MGILSCGWDYTAVGIESCETIQLWEQRAVGLYSCGNRELWDYTAVGTESCGTIQLWNRELREPTSRGPILKVTQLPSK